MAMTGSDIAVFALLLAALLVWAYVMFRKWLFLPPEVTIPVSDEPIEVNEAVLLLEEEGYEVVNKKTQVKVHIKIDGAPIPPGQLFIDYIARKENSYYLVKIARARKPLEMTGAAIRERLLPYAYVYEEAEGILYVDVPQRSIRLIQFELEL
ncbi:hypothetical protein [Paenibacillus turpanensis]|uniref:hypothetical protein n=1 Tax=Paenibacillus turpanensis TaxID=2689078 RepID=UPI00140CB0E1|nr:hypothetical protein [Paenibacillus turpanensis]